MPSLRELQLAFLDAVYADAPERVAALTHESLDALRVRLGVYSHNLVANATHALGLGFPTVRALGGDEWFDGCVREYVRVHRSRSGDLHWLGERFAAFLGAQFADGPYAYFGDVARLEWAYQEVIVAADAPALDLAALAAVPDEQHAGLVFATHPAARVVVSPWPILDLWRAHRPGAPGDVRIDLHAGGQRVLVIRRPDHVELAEVGPEAASLFQVLAAGASLGAVLERLGTGFPLGPALAALATRGALAGFELAGGAVVLDEATLR